jgi:murein DD-endopeptidase MepM/ murein hydrolase activator NlpD
MSVPRRSRLIWVALCAVICHLALPMPAWAAPPAQQGEVVHVVQAGETLFAIAQQYGVTVNAIVAANEIADPDWIHVGQRLRIPSAGAEPPPTVSTIQYAVQPGDTLALIARRYGTSVQELAERNRLANPHLIYVGQVLEIPSTGTEVRPAGGTVYVVQAGDTLARIAGRYRLSVWALAQANQIDNPSLIRVGQQLLIPISGGDSNLPPPFVSLRLVPSIAVQGRTVQVEVETDGEAELAGTFGGQSLVFVGQDSAYRTLLGIPGMASPGSYALDLVAKQNGRTVSVRSLIQVAAGSFRVLYLTIPSDRQWLLDPELVAAEAQRVRTVMGQVSLPGMWDGPFSIPLAGDPPINDPYGTRRSYNGGPANSYHGGVDYDAEEGDPVYCPAAGRVVLAEPLQVRGNAVIVDHGRGVLTGYWHLAQTAVTVGQQVARGDVLAYVGNTGLSTGPHLHWEVRVTGVQVDPLQWVGENIQ